MTGEAVGAGKFNALDLGHDVAIGRPACATRWRRRTIIGLVPYDDDAHRGAGVLPDISEPSVELQKRGPPRDIVGEETTRRGPKVGSRDGPEGLLEGGGGGEGMSRMPRPLPVPRSVQMSEPVVMLVPVPVPVSVPVPRPLPVAVAVAAQAPPPPAPLPPFLSAGVLGRRA